jgi:hypothetical protein
LEGDEWEIIFAGGILKIGKSGTFLLVASQPEAWAPNVGYHQIQHTLKVQKFPSTEFLTIVVMCEQVVKSWGRNSENRKIGNVFTCGAATTCAMVKRRLQSDLACLKNAEITFHRVLTVDGDGLWEG